MPHTNFSTHVLNIDQVIIDGGSYYYSFWYVILNKGQAYEYFPRHTIVFGTAYDCECIPHTNISTHIRIISQVIVVRTAYKIRA